MLVRETIDMFLKRQEAEMAYDTHGVPEWVFCGVVTTPHTRRQHGILEIFGRVWTHRPKHKQGVWYQIDQSSDVAVIPSCRVMIEVATQVLLGGQIPQYTEFLGDDSPHNILK